MNRREFLKDAAIGSAAIVAAACAPEGLVDRKSGKDGKKTFGTMEYRRNRVSGDKVSLLGYGCMRWPLTTDGEGRKVVDQERVNSLVDKALEAGVNYFDLSPVYLDGECERTTGIALKRHSRDRYFVATKLSNFSDSSKEASLKMYYDSFEQIGVDYFDYYLLHSLGRGGLERFNKRYVDNGMMDFLLEERTKGKIRNLGFSFHGQEDDFNELIALHEKYHWDFVQIQMNYIDWSHAAGTRNADARYLYEELAKRDIPVVIMEPLQGGRLANIPVEAAELLKAAQPKRSVASWAFRFCGTYKNVLTVLSGMTYESNLEDNLKSFCDFKPLTDKELALLDKVAQKMTGAEFPTIGCNGCRYCMPCPWGVDIAGIFSHYNRAVYGEFHPESAEQEEYKRLRRKYLVSYDRVIESRRGASHCIGCGECLEKCPQSIDIPHELRKIDHYIEKLKREI